MRKKLGYIAFMSVSVVLLCEAGLRILRYTPYVPFKIDIGFSPKSCFATDSILGIGLEPGDFLVTINQGLTYQASHTEEHERNCGDTLGKGSFPELWFLGCSMTYGMGVNDSCAYPYRVQAALPNYYVRNLAVPGAGTLHQFLRLKNYLAEGHRPEKVVLSYLDFHDSRNVFSSATAMLLRIGISANERPPGQAWGYAYGRICADTLCIKVKNLDKPLRNLPGIRFSALANLLNQTLDRYTDRKLPADAVTKQALLKSRDLCTAQGIDFYVTFMKEGGQNEAIRAFCAAQGIKTIDISVDFGAPGMNNRPYDSHPSALAHRLMAQKFLAGLNQL